MGFFSIELTDYNGKKFYNVTTDKWLREYPEDYKNYIKKTWEVKEHRMYKLIALMDERDSYMIGLLNVFQATLARDLNDKDYKFVAKLIEVQRRRVYREDIYLGLLFAYMHRQTRKAIYKMVFSDDIDKYDEESLRTVLVFAGNFIDITGYLKPGEVIPESVYLEANKKFFDTFVRKDKFWEDFLVEGSIKANGTPVLLLMMSAAYSLPTSCESSFAASERMSCFIKDRDLQSLSFVSSISIFCCSPFFFFIWKVC